MLWVLAVHIIAVISWMAGLLYLPRLFVYHAMTREVAVREQLKVMEHKLFFYIMNPAALVSCLSGFWLMVVYLALPSAQSGWLLAKLLLVLLLVIHHILCGWHLFQFKADRNQRSHRYYRWFNEVPTLLMIGIVILAVVKPF
jgi:putative membrane protein